MTQVGYTASDTVTTRLTRLHVAAAGSAVLVYSALTGPAMPGIALLAKNEQQVPSRPARVVHELPRGSGVVPVSAEDEPRWRDAVTEAMRGRRGAAVVVDRATGRVLAAQNIAEAEHMAVAPGSVLKPLSLWALLQQGKVTALDALPCAGALRIGSHNMTCSHPRVAQAMTVDSAIAYSCNNFVAHYAARFEDGQLAAFLHSEGLPMARRAASVERRQLEALGEEDVRATPLEIARAYVRMAKSAPRPVLDGLREATEYGTARLADVAGLSGKTGTAGGRAWFAGFTSSVAVVVVVPGASGGVDAAPIAKQIVAPGGVWVRGARTEPARYLTMEEYVAAVLAGECQGFTSDEALKAMAVAARSYAAHFRGQHRREGFDFCTTTHCQVMRLDAVTERERAAAEETAGELLWHDGAVASAYYSQDCGGVTEAAANVWPDEEGSYLRQRGDNWCLRTGRALWSVAIGRADLSKALAAAGLRAPKRIEAIDVAEQTPSGRALTLSLSGAGETLRMSASSFRFALGRSLGWGLVKSMFFHVREHGEQFSVEGYGAGHGVGLCQKGADQMGAAGHDYREILAFYYPGARIGQTARGLDWRRLRGERVDIVTADPHRDQQLVRMADAALERAEELTGFQTEVRPLVRVYPTVSLYRNGTAESGNVAGDTRGRVIRLQPNPAPQTLLHEMLHLLVEAHCRPGAPRSVREGIVAYLAGDQRVPEDVRSEVRQQGPAAVLASLMQPPSQNP